MEYLLFIRIIVSFLLIYTRLTLSLSLSSTNVEFHKVSFIKGVTFLDVHVAGSESNPQSLLFDTGSIHTYVLNHKMMKELPRGRRPFDAADPNPPVRGYRKTLISPKSVVTADDNEVNFAGFSGLQLEKWTSKDFTLGSHVWNQRFAVARLPFDQFQKHDPRDTGLIGASPNSRFTYLHPHFGFIPRDLDKDDFSVEFFLDHIQGSWCVGDLVAYTPLVHDQFWLFQGGMKFGTVTILSKFKVLVDSGSSIMAIPEPYFSQVQLLLKGFGVDWFTDGIFGEISCSKVHSLPPIHFETESGYTITILPEYYAREIGPGFCWVYISRKMINLDWITIGEPMVRFIATEFDAKKKRMGFCEPKTKLNDPPLIDQTPLVRKTGDIGATEFKRVNRRVYCKHKYEISQNPPSSDYPDIPHHRGNDGSYPVLHRGSGGPLSSLLPTLLLLLLLIGVHFF